MNTAIEKKKKVKKKELRCLIIDRRVSHICDKISSLASMYSREFYDGFMGDRYRACTKIECDLLDLQKELNEAAQFYEESEAQ